MDLRAEIDDEERESILLFDMSIVFLQTVNKLESQLKCI